MAVRDYGPMQIKLLDKRIPLPAEKKKVRKREKTWLCIDYEQQETYMASVTIWYQTINMLLYPPACSRSNLWLLVLKGSQTRVW